MSTSEAFVDQPAGIRRGEELDAPRLAAHLRRALPEYGGELELRQFPSGFSNLTYFLRLGERELVLRRPPFGTHAASAHDMSREYFVLSHLVRVYDRVPRPVYYCDDPEVFGAPFYLMERVTGVILRREAPPGLDLTPARMARVAEAFIDNLVTLHGLDLDAAGLSGWGKPAGYNRRQVEGWARRYQRARTEDIPQLEEVARWLADHVPAESGAALIHNDYKYDNLVLDPDDLGRIRAVLDWEMATVGDPLMDLGTSLSYWCEPDDPPALQMFGLTHLPGNPSRRELVARYAAAGGRDAGSALFYYVYGLFKLAGIIQQIYYRFDRGHTRDPRFGALIHVVRACGRQAAAALERDRISDLN